MNVLPEDWQRAIAVVAHPDDLEYGASAAVARWTGQNKDVRYVLATRGEAGIDSIPPEQAAPLRTKEQEDSAAVVGGLRRRVPRPSRWPGRQRSRATTGSCSGGFAATAQRSSSPRTTGCVGHDGPWNHVDHRELGSALPDAVRDAANRWLFTDAGPPWAGVRWIAYASSTAPTHAVDVTDSFAAGVASLQCHRTYIEALGDPDFDPESFLRSGAEAAGALLGVELAVTFELVDLTLDGPTKLSGPQPLDAARDRATRWPTRRHHHRRTFQLHHPRRRGQVRHPPKPIEPRSAAARRASRGRPRTIASTKPEEV